MVIVTDISDLPRITNPAIQDLVAFRLQQLGSDASESAEIITVEPGDAASDIEQTAGFPILTSLFDDLPYNHPDFYPNHEYLKEHHHEQYRFYEMVIGCSADGAVAIFIPDQEGIDADLLALCRSWATSSSDPAVSTP